MVCKINNYSSNPYAMPLFLIQDGTYNKWTKITQLFQQEMEIENQR